MRSILQDLVKDAKATCVDEYVNMKRDIRSTKFNRGTIFAIFCCLLVLVGNVILLIALNFWLSVMPNEAIKHNSSQIAIQVIAMVFMLMFFSFFVLAFLIKCGIRPILRVLWTKECVRSPQYRLFLLFASGATNGISSVLSIYAMTYTPQFLQAVLLCAIPFSAQAWTVIFIPMERKRQYVSLFFISSFVFFVAGVLLSSLESFMNPVVRASLPWALIYLLSSVVFGLWCVVQRLYLDAIVLNPCNQEGEKSQEDEDPLPLEEEEEENEEVAPILLGADHMEEGEVVKPVLRTHDGGYAAQQRQWAQQNSFETASKLTLLYVGIFFQVVVSFVCFPVDAIPWFGTSNTVNEAWIAFSTSIVFIFSSWDHVRYGLLYSFGFAQSFIGCTYLNEHSPTLSSVVMQLAGPVTSLMLIIVPQWNITEDGTNLPEKICGTILLFLAAVCYHFWYQHSLRDLLTKMNDEEAKKKNNNNNTSEKENEPMEGGEERQANEEDALDYLRTWNEPSAAKQSHLVADDIVVDVVGKEEENPNTDV